MMKSCVNCVRLTEVQKHLLMEVLGKATTLLHQWSVYYNKNGRKFRQFRNDLFSSDKKRQEVAINSVPSVKRAKFKNDLTTIFAVRQPHAFLNGRTIEQAVLEEYAALAIKLVKKWHIQTSKMAYMDMLQEAYMQIIESMFSWLPETARQDTQKKCASLTTVVYVGIKNRMSCLVKESTLLSPMTNEDLGLYIKYQSKCKEMKVANSSATFDDVVKSLKISKSESANLYQLLVRVQNEQGEAGGSCDVINDYTCGRKDLTSVSHDEIFVQTQEVLHMFELADLNDLERAVMLAAMESFHGNDKADYGWQTEFAKKSMNVETKKPYSRMRISQVLKEAQEKLQIAVKLAKKKAA